MIKLLLSLIAAVAITTKAQPALGVYDYAQTFTAAKNISYEQIWDWWDTRVTTWVATPPTQNH